jgi:hypothetical protein
MHILPNKIISFGSDVDIKNYSSSLTAELFTWFVSVTSWFPEILANESVTELSAIIARGGTQMMYLYCVIQLAQSPLMAISPAGWSPTCR